MSVQYKDYYAVLGVDRDATADTIKKSYRNLAKELHPDRNPSAEAKARFAEINEAYEVLSDPEKKAKYDQLGAGWEHGHSFDPRTAGGFRVDDLFGGMGGQSGFSDFFEILFGGQSPGQGFSGYAGPQKGADLQATLTIGLDDLLDPGTKRLTLGSGQTVRIQLPNGVRPGQQIRVAGKGQPGTQGVPAGDLFLRVQVDLPSNVELKGDDIVTSARVPVVRAVLGGTISVSAPGGSIQVKVPESTQAGHVLRVRGRGLKRKAGGRGDLRIRIEIDLPKTLTPDQRRLYEQLAELES